MVSPSAPHLQLLTSESPSDGSTLLRFIAHFALETGDAPATSLDSAFVIVRSPYSPHSRIGPPHGEYQLLKVTFARAIASRILPSYSDSEVVNPALFDFSEVPFRAGGGCDPEGWLRAFQSAWVRERLCPDPRMYEVVDSSWLSELDAQGKFKHFLVLGHDAYAEVAASGWEWVSEGSVS
jgi:hypothetical protein